ncbi:MurR/RpiR family transcriptional regulator [Marinomonas colpomeniae]|uniref:MurR/RpiR family transcriptional regulator n=1 Tax=Marinomonas colpomeniae TaxID=2774408 RepID=A0ABR8NYA8_9GAMM|nr:MurR/RpiR family transcriptional regulator [Marinomonas colpomeniae]MBD5769477.1 MurR/RpiR family transcriptional regulator [Marinomonas colpomeniae]
MSSLPIKHQPAQNLDTVLKAISDIYTTLTPQLKKAADYVLENPIDIALLPIRKSSEAAGVTPSAMTRLAKVLGFERYNNFKNIFKQAVHTKAPVNYGSRAQLLQEVSEANPSNKVFQEFAECAFKDLEHLFNDETLTKLQLAAAMILKAKNVFALGFRDAFACAHHFAYVGSMAFPNFRLIRGYDGNLLSDLVKITPDDIVVVFGSDSYAIETVNSIEMIKGQGAHIIAITDDLRSPLAAGADEVFIVETDTPHFFPTILSVIALAEALLSECVTLGGPPIVKNISKFENDLRRVGAYYSLK